MQLPASPACTRKYAVAAAAKKKSEASPKATSAGSKPIPNASAKGSAKTTKKPAKPTQGKVVAATTSQPAPTTSVKNPEVTPAPPPTSTTTATPSGVSKKKKEEPAISEQEAQLRQLEQLQLMSRLMPQVDPWGQQIHESLDVMIPASVTWKNFSIKRMFKNLFNNRQNALKNAISLYVLAASDALPGISLEKTRWWQKLLWPYKAFTTQSVKRGAWMQPLAQIALETYQKINTAVARHEEKGVKTYTTSDYQKHMLDLTRSRKRGGFSFIWRFHNEVQPTRIVSLRVTDGYLGSEKPRLGHRYLVHALVRLDTEQSLEIYDSRGSVLHEPAGPKTESGTTPAHPKRVTEYLVLEKRLWYNSPWAFREQLWEIPPGIEEKKA